MAYADLVAFAGAGTALALATLVAHRLYRRLGLVPLVALLTMHAVALAAYGFAPAPDVPGYFRASLASLTILPALVIGVLAVYVTHGTRTVRALCFLPLFGGVAVAGSILVDLPIPLLPPPESLMTTAPGAVYLGIVGTLACLAATAVFAGLDRMAGGNAPGFAGFVAAMGGLGTYGIVVYAIARLEGPDVPGTAIGQALGPFAVGLGASVLLALALLDLTRRFPPEVRKVMSNRSVFGALSLLDDAERLDTAIKEAEASRRETDHAFRGMLDDTRDGVFIADARGQIKYANGRLAEMVDDPTRDLRGANVKYLFPLHARRAGAFDDALVPGRHRIEVRLASGQRRTYDVHVATERGGGDFAGMIRGTVRDATEEVLRREIADRKERAEFYVHLLRHDVGNYVAPPISNIEVLLMDDKHDEDTRELLEACRRQLGRVRELLMQVDTLATLDRADPTPIDLVGVVQDVVDDMAAAHPDDLVIRAHVPQGTVPVRGLAIIDQVLVNLLNNARRHCPAPVAVDVHLRQEGGFAVLEVKDDGPGVPPELRAGLWEYGGRGEGSTGKGLGLYLVRTIAESLGGDAEVDDREDGHGAVFRIRFPLAGSEAASNRPAWAGSRGDGKASA